ncbi:MAG: hypothetical protein JW782_02230 [Candidatus Saganbacteria bacterium]|nr:hypothetical protein [Candidatus Saganbacteria bacterium]
MKKIIRSMGIFAGIVAVSTLVLLSGLAGEAQIIPTRTTTTTTLFRSMLPATTTTIPSVTTPVFQYINVQGRLTNKTGRPITNEDQSIGFRIYDQETGGTVRWTGSYKVNCDENGIFSAVIGPVNYDFKGQIPYLSIDIGNGEFSDRQALVSVPYAITANNVIGGTVANVERITVQSDGLVSLPSRTTVGDILITDMAGGGNYVSKDGDTMTGTLNVNVTTQDQQGIIAQSLGGSGIKGTSGLGLGDEAGVYGENINPATSGAGPGVKGKSLYGVGVDGESTNGIGVVGRGAKIGGSFGSTTNTGYGVYGLSPSGVAVYGDSTGGVGVQGKGGTAGGSFESESGHGVYGISRTKQGVYGVSTLSYGVRGYSENNYGIYGSSKNQCGVRGDSDASHGVIGSTGASNRAGIYGIGGAVGGNGVVGESLSEKGSALKGTNRYGGPALEIVEGAIKVPNIDPDSAHLAENQSVHVATASSINMDVVAGKIANGTGEDKWIRINNKYVTTNSIIIATPLQRNNEVAVGTIRNGSFDIYLENLKVSCFLVIGQ